MRRSAHESYGLYDPRYGWDSDVELWMRLSAHGDVCYVKGPLIKIRERETGNLISANWEQCSRAVFEIHQRYLPVAFPRGQRILRRIGLEYRFRKDMLRGILSQAKRSVLAKRNRDAKG